jgi:hypothetical protein
MPLIPIFVQNALTASDSLLLSAFNFCDPFDHVLPFSDGTIDSADRAHLWGMYSGIAISGGIVPVWAIYAGANT